MIRYLKHYEIDKEQWDNCMSRAHNGLIYANSWYLDIVSPGWEALVEDDYKTIMPLPVKKKFKLAYLIQPLFVQQLGIFSVESINAITIQKFLDAMPRKFLWKCFYWNNESLAHDFEGFSPRVNYELNLSPTYEKVSEGYSENTKRNLLKARKSGVKIEVVNDFCGFHELYRQFHKLSPDEFEVFQLQQIVQHAIFRKSAVILLARDHKKEVVAGALFLTGLNRIIYLTSFMSPTGYQDSLMFLLMDDIIRRNCGTGKIFDFEGSMIPGIARFFSGFGSYKTEYFEYKSNIINSLVSGR